MEKDDEVDIDQQKVNNKDHVHVDQTEIEIPSQVESTVETMNSSNCSFHHDLISFLISGHFSS